MSDVQLYELASAQKRGEINLMILEVTLRELFARARPEAYDLRVFKDFYCFRLRECSDKERIGQARRFGKVLVAETREVTQAAIRSFHSDGHPISNQLFKKVLGKGRQAYCEAELRKVGYWED